MAGMTAADEIRAPGALALRPRMVGALVWLRWRTLAHRLGRSAGAIVGLVIMLVFLVPLGVLITIGTAAAYRNLAPAQAGNVLFYVLGGVYVVWALLPLMQFTTNEMLDVTKLAQYPLTRPELMVGLILSTLLDVPTLVLLATLIGVGLGWGANVAQIAAIVGVLVVAYVHIVGISQLLLTSLMRLLRSRRYRDLSIVLFTLLGLSCSLGSQLIFRSEAVSAASANIVLGALRYDVGAWLQYAPPGMAARAVQAIAASDWAAAGLWSGALVVSAVAVVWLWQGLLARGLVTAAQYGSGRPPRRAAVVSAPERPTRRGLLDGIPAPILALARKDLLYYWRDPRFKQVLLRSLYFVGLLVVFAVSGRRTGFGVTAQFVLLGAVLLTQGLAANAFGYEGEATGTLALFPVRGAYVFLGKNLAVFLVGLVEMAVIVGLQAALTGAWTAVPGYALAVVAGMLVAIGAGNVIAVLFPLRSSRLEVGRTQVDSGTGCLSSLQGTAAYAIAQILLIPVALALVLPPLLGRPGLVAITLPLAAIYALGIYSAGTAWAARLYFDRLPEILRVVTKE